MLYLISIGSYQADTAISLLAVNARLPIAVSYTHLEERFWNTDEYASTAK